MTPRIFIWCVLVLNGGLASAATEWNVTDFGALADGRTLATAAIQRTIDTCAAAGGGRVVVPAGRFVSGPVFLKSHVDFYLAPGAVLAGSEDFSDYPVIPGRWEGIERPIHASLVTAVDAVNISITGRGTIDGRGDRWWIATIATDKARKEAGLVGREPDNPPSAPLRYPRPRAIYLQNCRDVLLSGITVQNSPSWTVHPVYCEDVVIDGLTITSPPRSHNTDGIDPDSCRNVRIANCRIISRDDGIIIKSGYNADGRRVGRPCENITITNCVIGPAIAAVGIGSETAGGVRNVTVENCVFDSTRDGLRVKTARGRGAVIENFRASNIVMRNIGAVALGITTAYDGEARTPKPVDETTPTVRNIAWSHLTIDGAANVGEFDGLAERYLQDVSLDHITVRGAGRGLQALHVEGLRMVGLSLDVAEGPAVQIERCRGVGLESVNARPERNGTPLIRLTAAEDVSIRACQPPRGPGAFLELFGAENRHIGLQANSLAEAVKWETGASGADPEVVTVIP